MIEKVEILKSLISESTLDLVSCELVGVVVRTEFHNIKHDTDIKFDTVNQGTEQYLASLIVGAYMTLSKMKLNQIEAGIRYKERMKQKELDISVKCNAIIAAHADLENEQWKRDRQDNMEALSKILTSYIDGCEELYSRWGY